MKETILNEILAWSKTLPQWQADAVRRLFVRVELTEEDFEEIYCMAKAQYKIKQTVDPPIPIPLSKEHIPATPIKGEPTILTSMFDVVNVNALVEEQTLTFGPKGLTIIYGGNGTGKSGYARVLKRACRARHTEKKILSNVFSLDQFGRQKASFTLKSGSLNPIVWSEGESNPPELSELSVFDAHCARVFIDEANEVSYVPFGLDIFPKLASLCDDFKSRAQKEQASQNYREAILEELSGSHEVGRVIDSLSSQTKPTRITALATLSEKEANRLKELEKQLQHFRKNDPRKEAEGMRRLQRRIINLNQALQESYRTIGDDFEQAAYDAWKTEKQATEVARMASVKQFENEPLPGIGSDPWKTMFQYAEEFSVQAAYPNKPFPVTDEGSRCVLCLQSLGSDAKDRFVKFWNFIQDRTSQNLKLARAELEKYILIAKELKISSVDQELIKEIAGYDNKLPKMITGCAKQILERTSKIIVNMQNNRWDKLPPTDFSVFEQLEKFRNDLNKKADKLDKLAKAENIAELEAEFSQLAARKKLSKHKDVVLNQLFRLGEQAKYGKLINSLGTRDITIMSSNLTERALTKALQDAFNEELKELSMHIDVNFKKTGYRGQTKHKLQIKKTHLHNQAALSEVLSEGEQHVIGLAAFLAELRVTSGISGIILDDPVSSLDHRWMDKVAERLVKEAEKRQVIVFTHNISFVLSAKKFASEQQVPIHAQWLKRIQNLPGHCTSEIPWEILGAKERRKSLAELVDEARIYYNQDPEGEKFCSSHNKFYDRLRSTWERTVEEVVLNETVIRFRNSVETNRLRGVVIDDNDFKTIFEAISRASGEIQAHDHAADLCHTLKIPDQMDTEIKNLKDFTSQLDERKKETLRRRKDLTLPPKG